MHGDFAPAEKPLRGGQEQVRRNMALQIADHQRPPCHCVETGQQASHLVVSEMVQEQRAEYKIKASRFEWERKSIGNQLWLPGPAQVDQVVIQAGDGGRCIVFLNDPRAVSGSRADIQEGESLMALHHQVKCLSNAGMTTEPPIDPDQIGQIFRGYGRWSVV